MISPEAAARGRRNFDEKLREECGAFRLIGVDEVGRGPLAGPVVSAAVILPETIPLELSLARDSKKVSPLKREKIFKALKASGAAIGVGWASADEIDRLNILQATFLSMRRAVSRLRLGSESGTLLAVDGNRAIPGLSIAQKTVVSGDELSLSIAAASIAAKVVRDRWMTVLSMRYPDYGFEKHKGYGTADHYKELARIGACPEHRRSFLP